MDKRHALAFGMSVVLGSSWALAQGQEPGKGASRTTQKHADSFRKDQHDNDYWLRPDLFQAVDTDDEGTISKAELNAFFVRADVDKDGTVSRQEVNKAIIGAWVDRIETMDKNGDGNITRDEWRGPRELFDQIDPDNDGSMTRDELRKGLVRMREEHGRGDRPLGKSRRPSSGVEKQE